MNELLLAEMKRAVELLERNIKLERKVPSSYNPKYKTLNRELVELVQLNKMIRKHSVKLEQEIGKQQGW